MRQWLSAIALGAVVVAGATAQQSDPIKTQLSQLYDTLMTQEQALIAGINGRLDADDINFQNVNARLQTDEANIAANTAQIADLQSKLLTLSSASAPRVFTTKASVGGALDISVNAGERLLVECNGDLGAALALSDNLDTSYASLGQVDGPSYTQAVYFSPPLTAGTVSLSCVGSAEVYALNVRASSATAVQSSGATSPATNSVSAQAGDLLVAFCVTWQCSNTAAWTALSTYHNNLVTARYPVLPGTMTASFPVNRDWVLSVVTLR